MSTNHMTHRCSICDRTNNLDLITYPEQYTPGPFRNDPHDPLGEICSECDDEIFEALDYWSEEDGEED